MSIVIHRPKTLSEAAALLQSEQLTLPFGGGTVIKGSSELRFAAVELQGLGLDTIEQRSRMLAIGACVTLDALLDHPDVPDAVVEAIKQEAPRNVRKTATVAGSLIAADGRSPLAAAMLALDAKTVFHPEKTTTGIGDILNQRLNAGGFSYLPGKLITQFLVSSGLVLWYGQEKKESDERAFATVAMAEWPSGRRRIAVGGWGTLPRLAFDGPQPGGEEVTVQSITAEAGDELASAADRQAAAVGLTREALAYFEAL